MQMDRSWLRGVLPSGPAEQLLQAALMEGDGAWRAWQSWTGQGRLDRPDEASFRLLPLVHRNLTRQGFCAPEAKILKGIYRQAWLKNQMLLHRTGQVLRELHAAGVQTMVLKGAALSLLHYRDAGLRPMRDVDVLIPCERAQEAADFLARSGWRRLTWAPEQLTDAYLRFRHSMCFAHGPNEEFDLHWHPLGLVRDGEADQALWASSVPLEIYGQRTLALDATGQLLHACLHGMAWNSVAPIRWVADAMTILRTADTIRWEFLVEFARRNRIELFLSPALEYLARTFEAPVPSSALRDMKRTAVSRTDLAEFRRAVLTEEFQGALDTCLAMYRRHWRGSRELPAPARLMGFPAFLQCYWKVDTAWELVSRSATWTWRRATGL
jgi:hypothetical protein